MEFRDDTSYSAGIAYVLKKEGSHPELLLVLQKGGEKNAQAAGGVFVEKRTWKMPMGHFDPLKDEDLLDTARREFEEEAGFHISREELQEAKRTAIRISSERPGAAFHEDHFFFVVSPEKPRESKRLPDDIVETVDFFALHALPEEIHPRSRGAALAHGHKKKLRTILLEHGKILLEK